MSFELSSILSLSVVVGVVISWVRFKNINRKFVPFVLLLTCGFLHEIISIIIIEFNRSNAVVYNIYSLVEAILIVWQFKKWDLIKFGRISVILLGTLVFLWAVENFFISSIQFFNSYFLILYSFLIVFLSIHTLNVLIINERSLLVKNSTFLICIGFILYFTYSIIVEVFWMYGLNRSIGFQTKIYEILIFMNLFVNLLYAIAVVWIPTKPKFMLLS